MSPCMVFRESSCHTLPSVTDGLFLLDARHHCMLQLMTSSAVYYRFPLAQTWISWYHVQCQWVVLLFFQWGVASGGVDAGIIGHITFS